MRSDWGIRMVLGEQGCRDSGPWLCTWLAVRTAVSLGLSWPAAPRAGRAGALEAGDRSIPALALPARPLWPALPVLRDKRGFSSQESLGTQGSNSTGRQGPRQETAGILNHHKAFLPERTKHQLEKNSHLSVLLVWAKKGSASKKAPNNIRFPVFHICWQRAAISSSVRAMKSPLLVYLNWDNQCFLSL